MVHPYILSGAVYRELPLIKDAEEDEIEANRGKKKKKGGFLEAIGLGAVGAMFAGPNEKEQERQLRAIIGFPSQWANTDFLTGREWWIQSKKKGEGGGVEQYLVTHPFEMYELSRGHIAFNKFGKRKDTTRKVLLSSPTPTPP